MDNVELKLATAALEAAGYAIGEVLEETHFVELIGSGPTQRQYRVSYRQDADKVPQPPRYFIVRVTEHRPTYSAPNL